MMNPEGTSAAFNEETYMEARKLAKKLILLFAYHVEAGMSEDDGLQILNELFEKHGIVNKWHPHKFRIGKNTTCAFRDKSDKSVRLQENDIYFVDIGPVIKGHEADLGMTFTVGQNPEYSMIQKASKDVFMATQEYWNNNNVTGKELYEFASSCAKELGYELNDKMHGHRLGDFPHALYYKGSLSSFAKAPIEKLWVLEILLKHPEKEFGAFYEDVLLRNS